MPDEFVPLAERTGAIGDLTSSVLAAALAQVRAWNDEQLKLTCAVNLPPTLVTDLSFPDRVAALLGRYSLDGSQLVLEITETATMQNPTMTMDILTRLRVKRIGLSLDDFGTGYSSLTQLYQMPFNEMKIDKSLVINVPHSREANTMVGSLIELGHNLGLKICAEGVENRAALDMLAILRCDRCQGFFISRAVPAPRHTEPREPLEPREPGRVVHGAADARSSEEHRSERKPLARGGRRLGGGRVLRPGRRGPGLRDQGPARSRASSRRPCSTSRRP